MRAKLLSNAISTGQTALDYIRLVRENRESAKPDMPLPGQTASEILESFQDENVLLFETVVPVKGLVCALTEGLQGTSDSSTKSGRVDATRLHLGCRVRLAGIRERLFMVIDVFWDLGEVRIKEIGGKAQYVLPWDCLRSAGDQSK